MERRAALAALLAAALAPGARGANEGGKRVGYLSGGGPPGELATRLADLGWIPGKTLQFEVSMAPPGSPPLLVTEAVAELVRANVDVLVGFLDRADALAAATKTIPIVAGFHPDPVGLGLAQSLRRPGGNVTGLSAGTRETASAWLGLLRTMRPQLRSMAILHAQGGEERMRAVARTWVEVAAPMGITISFVRCATLSDVSRAFDAFGDPKWGGAFVVSGGMNTVALSEALMKSVLDLARRRKVATVGDAHQGALMSYEMNFTDPMARMAVIIDKILRGQKPAEIPFEVPDRTEFVLNRATAKAINVVLTPDVLLRVTETVG
jgi:putative ABC transport system substrate-binding protein